MKFLIMLAALAMMPRLLMFLSGGGSRNRIKIRMRRQWGPLEWVLIAVAVGTLLILGSCGLL